MHLTSCAVISKKIFDSFIIFLRIFIWGKVLLKALCQSCVKCSVTMPFMMDVSNSQSTSTTVTDRLWNISKQSLTPPHFQFPFHSINLVCHGKARCLFFLHGDVQGVEDIKNINQMCQFCSPFRVPTLCWPMYFLNLKDLGELNTREKTLPLDNQRTSTCGMIWTCSE